MIVGVLIVFVIVYLLARWRGQNDHCCMCGELCSCGAFTKDGQCHCLDTCKCTSADGFTVAICPCSQREPRESLPPAGTYTRNIMLPDAQDEPDNYAPVEPPFTPSDYFVYPRGGESFQVDYPDAQYSGFRTELRHEPDHVVLTN